MDIFRTLWAMLMNPKEFFNGIRVEGWKPCFVFFVCVTLVISVVTPVVNFLGIESTDLSSSYQAQIIAYNFAKDSLVPLYGDYAYMFETVLIFVLSLLILVFITLFLHAVYTIIGGSGPILNA
ncbi:hypothetical protein KEJ18_03115 [Candidatus Bathyarchaeota archaeon]|nr:hypothetical protein [Candidatus Bathyarchaeota archaeon]